MDRVLLLIGATGVLALVVFAAAWFVARGYKGLESFLRGQTGASWFDAVMPWPHGVQEEYDVHWHLGGDTAERQPAPQPFEAGLELDVEPVPTAPLRAVPPTRPQARLRRR